MCRKIFFLLAVWQSLSSSLQLEYTSSFGHCIKQDNPSLIKCAGQQAIETLQQFNEIDNFNLTDDVVLVKDESVMGRNNPINFYEQDPQDFRQVCAN